jgi:hypothetical protein
MWKISPACGVLADRRRRAVRVIGRWPRLADCLGVVDGIAAGLGKNSRRMVECRSEPIVDPSQRGRRKGSGCISGILGIKQFNVVAKYVP